MIFEDLCAVLPLFLDAKKVGRVHAKLYYYMKGRKGGTLSTYDERHGQIIDVLQIVNDVYRHRGEFEHFYDTLLFFNIRHIFARFDEMEHYLNHSLRKEFSERAFALLKAGGKVKLEPGELPWSPLAATVTDRFGVNWFLSLPQHLPPEDFKPSDCR